MRKWTPLSAARTRTPLYQKRCILTGGVNVLRSRHFIRKAAVSKWAKNTAGNAANPGVWWPRRTCNCLPAVQFGQGLPTRWSWSLRPAPPLPGPSACQAHPGVDGCVGSIMQHAARHIHEAVGRHRARGCRQASLGVRSALFTFALCPGDLRWPGRRACWGTLCSDALQLPCLWPGSQGGGACRVWWPRSRPTPWASPAPPAGGRACRPARPQALSNPQAQRPESKATTTSFTSAPARAAGPAARDQR
jgi:hypothetical protein